MRWLASVLLMAACAPHVNKCKDKTLFVQVTLDSAATQADQLIIEVALDGGGPVETKLDHTPGTGAGGIEVDFPGGYPAGHSARVDITATVAGVVVGSGGRTLDHLGASCQSATIMVMSSSSGDLALADLAQPPDGADLAQLPKPDLYSYDLAGADLVCVPSTEDCFNGVDDDCDGLIDCADPDCTGGATPKAVCVPDPGSFTAGITVAGSCPTAWPSATPINSGLTPGSCADGTCSCSLSTSECLVYIADYGADSSCTGNHSAGGYPQTCVPLDPPASGNYYSSSGKYFGNCTAGPSDAPVDTPPGWGAMEKFCSGGAVGGGCSGSDRCVPAGPNHCLIKPGSQVACPPNYTIQPTHYFTDFDDTGRSCTCKACTIGTDGSCSGVPTTLFYAGTDTTCSGSTKAFLVGGSCSNTTLDNPSYMRSTGMTLNTNATCNPGGASQTGMTVATGEQTVCCTP